MSIVPSSERAQPEPDHRLRDVAVDAGVEGVVGVEVERLLRALVAEVRVHEIEPALVVVLRQLLLRDEVAVRVLLAREAFLVGLRLRVRLPEDLRERLHGRVIGRLRRLLRGAPVLARSRLVDEEAHERGVVATEVARRVELEGLGGVRTLREDVDAGELANARERDARGPMAPEILDAAVREVIEVLALALARPLLQRALHR